MKVILLADVRKLGKKGDTVKVSDGYGANYLIPRGLAVASTEGSQKSLAKANAEESARQQECDAIGGTSVRLIRSQKPASGGFRSISASSSIRPRPMSLASPGSRSNSIKARPAK